MSDCSENAVYINVDDTCDDCSEFAQQLNNKQDKLIAGNNITIIGNTISATDTNTEYTAGAGIQISSGNVISATAKNYTAGSNISISSSGVISATDTKYTAGNNVQINGTVISATDTKYTAGNNVQISAGNVISATDTKYSVMGGATSSASGSSGLVPTPGAGKNHSFLRGDATWQDAYTTFSTLADGSSLNSVTESGSYLLSGSNTYTASPISGLSAVLFVMKNTNAGGLGTQILIDSSGMMYDRWVNYTNGTFSPWRKQFASMSVLSTGTSVSGVRAQGTYYLDSASTYTGLPSRIHPYGVLCVFEPMTTSDVTAQMLISDNGYATRYRTTGSWSSWLEVVTTQTIYNTTYNYRGLTVAVKKIGQVVTMNITGDTTSAIPTNEANAALCTLAERYRPADQYEAYAILSSGSTSFRFGRVYITVGGVVNFGYTRDASFANASIPSGTTVRFSATWLTEFMDS